MSEPPDVTEARRTERALRDSEARFWRLVEQAADGIFLSDREGRYTDVNSAGCAMLGYTREEILRMRVMDVVIPEQVPRVGPELDEVAAGRPYLREFTALRKNGTTFPAEVNAKLFPDGHIVAILRDVTERKRVEDQLRDLTASLRALSERVESAREEESARIARELHDQLGQALTGLRMDASWLEKRLAELDAGGRFVDSVRDKLTQRATQIEATIQTVRRISTELRPAVLDDVGLVAAVEWQAQEFQRRTGIRCSAVIPKAGLAVDSDRATALFRIFLEALTNIVRHAGADAIEVALDRSEGAVILEIRDDGKGIDGETARSTRSLGLLGMRERARVFGGEVIVTGTSGGGTTVSVRIPMP